jgi:hypothetical protein
MPTILRDDVKANSGNGLATMAEAMGALLNERPELSFFILPLSDARLPCCV